MTRSHDAIRAERPSHELGRQHVCVACAEWVESGHHGTPRSGVACPRCRAAHHLACWQGRRGCCNAQCSACVNVGASLGTPAIVVHSEEIALVALEEAPRASGGGWWVPTAVIGGSLGAMTLVYALGLVGSILHNREWPPPPLAALFLLALAGVATIALVLSGYGYRVCVDVPRTSGRLLAFLGLVSSVLALVTLVVGLASLELP